MAQPLVENKNLTIEQWIELEQSGEIRYEYHFGEVFAMAGGTLNHTKISTNTLFELEDHFRKTGDNCSAFNSDIKIEINKKGRYVYPDTLGVCGAPDESDDVSGAITNPIIVVEVLSDSSEGYDHGVKYKYYKRLSSVKEYLILDQRKYAATLYRRNGSGDIFSRIEYEGSDAIVELHSISLDIKLGKFYRNITFIGKD